MQEEVSLHHLQIQNLFQRVDSFLYLIVNYLVYHHFHLICEKCGKLIHLDCHEAEHLLVHIKDEHGFAIDVSKVNFYGLCDDCQKGGAK